MTGILLLGVLAIWGWANWWLAGRVCGGIERRHVRATARCLLFTLVLPLPLADEIYSMLEFARVCRTQAHVVVDNPQLAGKTVWFVGVQTLHRDIGLLPGLERRWSYVLPETGELALHHTDFQVRGGKFMQMLGISETGSPLLFDGSCASAEVPHLQSKLQVTVIDKPR